jgi:hypothetical protein
LIALEHFVEYLLATVRVVYPVMVLVRVPVKVVVLQQQVFTGTPANVRVRVTAYPHRISEVAGLKPLFDFQHNVVGAVDEAALQYRALSLVGERERVADYERMLA